MWRAPMPKRRRRWSSRAWLGNQFLMRLEMLMQPTTEEIDSVVRAIPLWYAQVAWAKELIARAFDLSKADDILWHENRGRRKVPGTNWHVCTHGVGVDLYRTPDVDGVDFDFDKPHPDAWRLKIFIERQVNAGNIPYDDFQRLLVEEECFDIAIEAALVLYYSDR